MTPILCIAFGFLVFEILFTIVLCRLLRGNRPIGYDDIEQMKYIASQSR